MKKKLLLGLLVLAAAAGPVWARVDFSTFPEPIEPGNVLINAAGPIMPAVFFLSPKDVQDPYGGIFFGGFAGIDYALQVPFTIGLEGGFFTGNLSASNDVSFSVIPIMGTFTWHPNWGIKNIDTHVGVKMGAARLSHKGHHIGEGVITASNKNEDGWGAALGSNVGIRCFFNHNFGMFVDIDTTMVIGKIQDTRTIAFFPRPSAGLTLKL
jgi:hypothetical protein